jgi:hypothetical protein
VVAAGGGGASTDVQAAVNAAVDGDVLLIEAGNDAAVEVNDKNLALVADTGANVHIDGVRESRRRRRRRRSWTRS